MRFAAFQDISVPVRPFISPLIFMI